jgi:Tol biopolymer transport system component
MNFLSMNSLSVKINLPKLLNQLNSCYLKSILQTSYFLFFFNLGCSQSVEPPKDPDNNISLYQFNAEFSHDGQIIVFVGDYDTVSAVHFITSEGEYQGHILENNSIRSNFFSSPSWSPDDSRIVVSLSGSLYQIKTNGDSLIRLTYSDQDFWCEWIPSGNIIAYNKTICDPDCGIAILNLGTNDNFVLSKFGQYPSWLSNSEEIAFVRQFYKRPTLQDSLKHYGFTIWKVNTMTGEEDSLYFFDAPGYFGRSCSISPNSQEVLVHVEDGFPVQYNIFKVNLENNSLIRLTTNGGAYPKWSRDGNKIVYTNTSINEGGLWIMNSDGSNKKSLTKLKR